MNSTVTDAIASTAGGFIVKSLARLVVDGSVLRHMTSRGAAGVMLADFAASGVFHNTTIHNSSALGGEGGVAVLADSATVTISDSVITNSTCVLLFEQSSAARTLPLLTPRQGCLHSAHKTLGHGGVFALSGSAFARLNRVTVIKACVAVCECVRVRVWLWPDRWSQSNSGADGGGGLVSLDNNAICSVECVLAGVF